MSAHVEALFRYPVKSMLGEQIDASEVGERRLLGDRAYALIDQETGKSAKNPRRWGMLFTYRAEFVEEPRVGSELPRDPGGRYCAPTRPGRRHLHGMSDIIIASGSSTSST